MKVGILGTGQVAQTLAGGFRGKGHEVVLGSRQASEHARTFAEAAEFGDLLVLAVKGSVAEVVLELAGTAALKGKVIADATNPIADEPPADGLVRFFTTPNESLMERLQARFPDARFVKAWSSVGSALMVDPKLPGGPPSMFICGNDAAAKATVGELLVRFGWEVEDLGTAVAARAIEPLCILWCIPGFLRNDWVHAFKVLRP